MPTSRAPGITCAMFVAWWAPIAPTPMTPMPTGGLAIGVVGVAIGGSGVPSAYLRGAPARAAWGGGRSVLRCALDKTSHRANPSGVGATPAPRPVLRGRRHTAD